MKVRDFLTQAYLNGTDRDPGKQQQLIKLQMFFADNPLAEVEACYRGLLVYNLRNNSEGRAFWKSGTLHLIDDKTMTTLTVQEDEGELLRLAGIFMQNREYFFNENGPEAFAEDYKKGVFSKDQPEK